MSEQATPHAVPMRPLNVSIVDRKELARAYMSFMKGGGLFIVPPDNVEFHLGQKVFVMLSLLDDKSKKPVSAKIAWIMKGGPNKGIGITLGEGAPAKAIKDYIETSIADLPGKSEALTYTI